MSGQKHTPGPWILDEECDGLVLAMGSRIENPSSYQTHHEIELYEEYSYDDFEREQREEAFANARLIAAAPDLLAACEKIVAWLDRLTADAERDKASRFVTIARAATADAANFRATAADVRKAIARATAEVEVGNG